MATDLKFKKGSGAPAIKEAGSFIVDTTNKKIFLDKDDIERIVIGTTDYNDLNNKPEIPEKIAVQNEEPAGAPEGALWLDLDADGTNTEFITLLSNHTADKNNPHGVTYEQVGAAPAGYGLGGYGTVRKINSISELDSFKANGWYTVWSDEVFYIDSMAFRSFTLKVSMYNEANGFQTIKFLGSTIRIERYCANGTWGRWRWNNPPMLLGVEYCTTELWNNQEVYVKAVNFGALPNNTYKDVSIQSSCGANSELIDTRFRIKSAADSYGTKTEFDSYVGIGETLNPSSTRAYIGTYSNTSGSHVARILTKEDMSSYTAIVIAKYTRG